jgi:hypothetical protein
LKAALREHTDRLRKLAAESLARKAATFKDRRRS